MSSGSSPSTVGERATSRRTRGSGSRSGGSWRPGVARLLPEDDASARQRLIGRRVNAAMVRAMGKDLMSVRVELEPEAGARQSAHARGRRALLLDGLIAGLAGALVGAFPSTLLALARRTNPLEPTLAAGSILLPSERRVGRLVLAAAPIHLALSVGWATALVAVLRRRASWYTGLASALAIAGLDLGLGGRRFPRIRALPVLPQIADHAAFGAAVGAIARRRRARR